MQAFIEHQQQSMQKIMEEANQNSVKQETVVDSDISVIENTKTVEHQSTESSLE